MNSYEKIEFNNEINRLTNQFRRFKSDSERIETRLNKKQFNQKTIKLISKLEEGIAAVSDTSIKFIKEQINE